MKNKVVISMLAITLAAGIGIGAATMSVTHTSTTRDTYIYRSPCK